MFGRKNLPFIVIGLIMILSAMVIEPMFPPREALQGGMILLGLCIIFLPSFIGVKKAIGLSLIFSSILLPEEVLGKALFLAAREGPPYNPFSPLHLIRVLLFFVGLILMLKPDLLDVAEKILVT